MDNKMLQEASTITEESTRDYAVEIKTKSGSSNVFRIPEGSESYRKYFISWMLCDDDKIKPFIVENDAEGKGVLARLLGDTSNFCKGGYLESKKGQFGKVFVHQAKDPELFKRITEYWNPAYNNTGTARPKKEYIYNALQRDPELIDNQMLNWCDVNKHTKIIRLGSRAFKSLAVVYENNGEFCDYDIVFSKSGSGTDTVSTMMKAGKNTNYNRIGPLTEEENKYEKYNLDEIVKLPSAYYILKNLRNTIERVDVVMGTTFIKELDDQLLIEQAEYEKSKAAYEQNNHTVVPNTVIPPTNNPFSDQAIPMDGNTPVLNQGVVQNQQQQIPVQNQQQAVVPNQVNPVQPPIQPPIQPPTNTVQVPPQPVQTQAFTTVVPEQQPIQTQQSQGVPVQQPEQPTSRVPESVSMEPCGHCSAVIPVGSVTCPKCGNALQSACDVCHNMFSVFSNMCPHCNTQYKTN